MVDQRILRVQQEDKAPEFLGLEPLQDSEASAALRQVEIRRHDRNHPVHIQGPHLVIKIPLLLIHRLSLFQSRHVTQTQLLLLQGLAHHINIQTLDLLAPAQDDQVLEVYRRVGGVEQ